MKHLSILLFRQSLMDFQRRYFGTLLGGVWAIISPLLSIGLIYFVFTYGLKTGQMGGISFINWLVPGMLIWFFMSESVVNGCFAITENSHLVTKVVFPVYILPPSKILAALPVHVLLISVVLMLLAYEGSGTVSTWWQLVYYLFCASILCAAISFITSSCMVFVRDTVQIVGAVVQILFWATPIFWNPALLTTPKLKLLLFNPFNYVVQGYRDALFNAVSFWEKPVEMFVFWVVTFFLIALGFVIFSRTRPHFADVL